MTEDAEVVDRGSVASSHRKVWNGGPSSSAEEYPVHGSVLV